MRLKVQMLTAAEAYCRAAGISEDRFGRMLFGDGRRLRKLRDGADMASGRVEDALQWVSDRWPPEAEWPADVPRPQAVPDTARPQD